MGKNKKLKGVVSNTSSTANPAVSSTTQTANRSSILRSSFSPSKLQLSLFASVIQGLDSHHLRVHETTTGRLRCEHAIASRASITCLDWGFHGENHRDRHRAESKKKRKRSQLSNGEIPGSDGKNGVIAYGTSDSSIHLFSITEARVLKSLSDSHTHGVRDFKFKDFGLHGEGWSVGGDAKLVQWDLKKGRAVRTVALPHGPASVLRPLESSIICASQNAYILNLDSSEQPPIFTASTNQVHSIVNSAVTAKTIRFLTAAETDRFINVFSSDSPMLIGSLRTESEILSLDSFYNGISLSDAATPEDFQLRRLRPEEVLLAINKDGALEIFSEPFEFGSSASEEELKSVKARMQKRSRPRDALVRVRRPNQSSLIVPLICASFQDNDITMAWVEGGINPVFEKLRWRDDGSGNLLLKDVIEITKQKSGAGIGATVVNGIKDMSKSHVDESHAVVVNGGVADDVSMVDGPPEIIEISSGGESDSEDEVPSRLAIEGNSGETKDAQVEDEDVVMEDTDAQGLINETLDHEKAVAEQEEPSFGDLIRANAPEAVDVQAAFTDPNTQSLVPTGDRSLHQMPSGMSFGTVLTQSLRTNDTNLLEACFHVRDLSTVRATIERLDSSFAATLLEKLAERLHSRPGRAGSLMVWIQWTLVAHGGYLAGRPEVMRRLSSLHRVVKDRANSLQPLLSLKGKLDMLEAQMNLRKTMQSRSRAANALDEDDEQGVIYVEGQEESDSEDEPAEKSIAPKPQIQKRRIKPRDHAADDHSEASNSDVDSDEDEESDQEMPTTNGVVAESEDEESDDDEGLIDDEASSTENDSSNEASENEVDHESIDSVDSSDADTSPPPKRPAKSKLSNGINAHKS